MINKLNSANTFWSFNTVNTEAHYWTLTQASSNYLVFWVEHHIKMVKIDNSEELAAPFKPVHVLTTYFLKIHYSIIIVSPSQSSK